MKKLAITLTMLLFVFSSVAFATDGFWKFKFNNTDKQNMALIKKLKDSGKIVEGGKGNGHFFVRGLEILGVKHTIEFSKLTDDNDYDRVIKVYPKWSWQRETEEKFDQVRQSMINRISKSNGSHTEVRTDTLVWDGGSPVKETVDYIWEFENSRIELRTSKMYLTDGGGKDYFSAGIDIMYYRIAKDAVKF